MGEALITRRGGGGGIDVAEVAGGRLNGYYIDGENSGWGDEETVQAGESITITNSLYYMYGNTMPPAKWRPKFGVFEFCTSSYGNRYNGILHQYFPFIAEADKETVTDYYTELDGHSTHLRCVSSFVGNTVKAVITVVSSTRSSGSIYNGIGRGTFSMEYVGS